MGTITPLTLILALSLGAGACTRDPSTTVILDDVVRAPADNSARNVRDRDGRTVTAGDQSENAEDVAITRSIRKNVVDSDALSTLAQNVKIITVNGIVTLRGPVKSEAEKRQIGATAERIAGLGKVQNQIEIAQ